MNGPAMGAGAPSGRSGAPALEGLLTLKLLNPSSLCYMNAAAFLLAFTLRVSSLVTSSSSGLGLVVNYLCRGHRRVVDLRQFMAWQALLVGWGQVVGDRASQQDCAEFLGHLLRRGGPPAAQGEWQARTVPETAQPAPVRDSGQGILYLELPDSATTLQDCITHWHAQHDPLVCPHALVRATPLVYLCLGRYRERSDGEGNHRTLKAQHRIQCTPHAELVIPVFQGSSTSVTMSRYRLLAGVYHLGDTVNRGHYRSFMASGDFASATAPHGSPTWWCTEDSQPAARCSSKQLRVLEQNCYVLCLQLC